MLVEEKQSEETALEPVAKTIEYAINHLSEKELIGLNRRIRLFRVCMSILFASTVMLYSTLYGEPDSSITGNIIYISTSSEISWHLYKRLVLFAVLIPISIIYLLSRAISPISLSTTISRKVQAEVCPFWVEFLIVLLPFALTCGFWATVGFDIL
ncbi:hypothetical protein [Acaryochloris sp. IP29b_bin.137]|uniref:hypothetical protein n=1 Tax=Acaryochloris sp. IP29b_bin.137 TaxID=2969217 RepID=UPI0026267E5B|nr:hypothetical protein [Acaryochloris sp. IP29b_bin.137]